MTLLSSIGVERQSQFPFSILNLFGVLDAKLESERIFAKKAKEIGSKTIIIRPGRLVGAPFTNSGIFTSISMPFKLFSKESPFVVLLDQFFSLIHIPLFHDRSGQTVPSETGS